MAAKKPTKKATSTGSPTLDAANAAKKFKAPKDYKPMTTAQKVALAASLTPAGRVVKGVATAAKASKGASKASRVIGEAINKGTRKTKTVDSQYRIDKYYHGGGETIKGAINARRATNMAAKDIQKRIAERNKAVTERIAKNSVKVINKNKPTAKKAVIKKPF